MPISDDEEANVANGDSLRSVPVEPGEAVGEEPLADLLPVVVKAEVCVNRDETLAGIGAMKKLDSVHSLE